ncbi:MAG: MerR family transcriptional regulator [Thermoanaerobaculia bacterium]
MKPGPELYKAAEACKMAEVAPYVLRYWETEFSALSEGKEKGASRLYSARDVRIISRIRELLYDEGFTVAGAKKRLDAEMREGRFDGGETAPPIAEQRKTASSSAPAARTAAAASRPADDASRSVAAAGSSERRKVIAELKEIVRLLDRSRRKSL